MKISFFELFFIFIFSFTYYVCYNFLVAKFVRENVVNKKELTALLTDRATTITTNLKAFLKKEEDVLEDTAVPVLYNEKSLNDLLVDTATDADYQTFLDEIVWVVRDLYKNYQFLRQDPAPDDYNSGYYLAFQFIRGEYPEKYEYLFRLAIDKGLDPIKLNNLFVERVADGDVLALGNAVIDKMQTGLSSILQGQEVRISITFAPQEYMDKKQELMDERQKEYDAKVAEQQEIAKQKDDAIKAIRLAEVVLNNLVDEIAEKHDLQELVNQTKESMGYL